MVKEFVEKASVLLGIRTITTNPIALGDCAEPLRIVRRVTTLDNLAAFVGMREMVLPAPVYGGVRVEVEVMA